MGSALEHRFQSKMSKYFEACRTQGIHFLPLPVSTLGGWHSRAISALTRLGRQLGRQTGREEDLTVRHLFQRLSTLLMKANASLILSRTPVHSTQEVDGDRPLFVNIFNIIHISICR